MSLNEFEIVKPFPKLNNPIAIAMIRPWIDVAKVGTLSMNFIQKHLRTKEIARLREPGKFFDLTRYRPRFRAVNRKSVLTSPNTLIHYGYQKSSNTDYLFLQIREPHTLGEQYSKSIADILMYFNVQEYCQIGAMYDSVPHTRPLLVFGSVEDKHISQTQNLISQKKRNYQGPTSIISMVADILERNNVGTNNIMAHLPHYINLEEDFMGCARILEILSAMYELPKSPKYYTRGMEQYEEITNAVRENTEVTMMVARLESYYDHVIANNYTEDSYIEKMGEIDLAPSIENFLREVTINMNNKEDDM